MTAVNELVIGALPKRGARNWHEYSPPSVLRWFSLVDLERLLAQFGFARIAKGRPPKRISGAHAKALLNYKLRDQPFAGMLHLITRTIPDSIEIPSPCRGPLLGAIQKTGGLP